MSKIRVPFSFWIEAEELEPPGKTIDHTSPWMTINEAASYARVSRRTLQEWLKSGLKFSKIGHKTVLIKSSWLDEYIEGFSDRSSRVDAIVNEIEKELRS